MPGLLVIGWGNPLRGDDAFGFLAAERLIPLLPEAEVLAVHQLTPELMDSVRQASQLQPEPDDTGSGALPLLPRRNPGALLAPEVAATAQAPAQNGATVDPEAVRARLSAFAEGVSAAHRRGNPSA